jgi:hypothetical protein
MKRLAVIAVISLFPSVLFAQQSAAQQQSQNVRLECRDMKQTGNFIYANETVQNGMACHEVKAAVVQPAKQAPAPAAKPEQAAPPDVPAVPPEPVTAASMRITPGATVFIEPMNGFGTYILAAFRKKNVELIPVASAEQAHYIISGVSDEKKAGFAKMFVMGDIHSDNEASIQMADRRTGAIVFAYSVNKKSTWHGDQTTAEACAKHLKSMMEKH